jgi:alpha-tubulin suppressor-like RCC1 family protein
MGVTVARFRLGTDRGLWAVFFAGVAAFGSVPGAQAGTVAAGASHTLVVKTTDSTVWAWGLNSDGQLGDNTTTQRKTPVQVTSLSSVVAVAAGAKHSLALESDGTLWAWGDNQYGEVGNGTTTDQKLPVQVLAGVAVIAAGDYHSIALKSDGTVWTWGLNGNGQLGDGGTTNRSSPAQVTGLGLVSAVAGGGNHTVVVLQAGGAMKAWGKNSNGQLGDGTTAQATNPVSVSGMSNAVVAAGGGSFTIALKNDATLLAWGLNSSGQLGIGSTTQKKTPTAITALTGVVTMATGGFHGLALLADGSVRAWGRDTYGNLGDGMTTQQNSPVPVLSLAGITAIGAGTNHNVAVTSTGEVWAWGYNNAYQIGDGTNVNRLSPVRIAEAGFQWKAATPTFGVASGTYSTTKSVTISCATSGATIRYTTDGTDPTPSSTAYSGAVSVTTSLTLKARAFKSGLADSNVGSATYTLVVTAPTLNPGTGTYTTAPTVTMSTTTTGATIRYTIDGSDPDAGSTAYTAPITVGTSTTVRAAGFLTGWTTSGVTAATYTMDFGPLTAPDITPASGTYVDSVMVAIAAAPGATIRYTTSGGDPSEASPIYGNPIPLQTSTEVRAAAWKPDYTPSPVSSSAYVIRAAPPVLSRPSGTYPPGSTVTVTAASAGSVLHYTTNGADPVEADPVVPSGGSIALGAFTLKVKAFKDGCDPSDVVSATYATGLGGVSAGEQFAVAVTPSGQVYAWGDNSEQQIGDGTFTPALLPKAVVGLSNAISVAAGGYHALAVTSDGVVWGWGANESGQIGDGTTTRRSAPVQVPGLTDVTVVRAGGSVSAALKSDHSLWMWGANGTGQLGLGDTNARLTPQLVMADVGEVAVAENHVLARKMDGSLWAWGFNQHGEVGDSSTTTRLSPVTIELTRVVRVAAGKSHSMALRDDGSVWTWGDNWACELGDGTTVPRVSPVRVPGLLSMSDLSAGREFTVASNADGSVWRWGRNDAGQLGDGTTTQRCSPTRSTVLANVTAVATGGWHAFAVVDDGSVWMWGANSHGQLGDGTYYDARNPKSLADVDFAWRAGTPTVDHYSGQYSTPFNLTLATASSGAVIHYTLDGSTPTASSTAYSAPISIGQTTTVTAKAMLAGVPDSNPTVVALELTTVPPTFSPAGGTYTSAQTVTMTTSTPGATIRYTTDVSLPDETSIEYTGPVTISTQTTLRARAFKSGWTPGGSHFATYTFNLGTLAPPTATPAAGTYSGEVSVSLSAMAGATIRYTTDGTTPTVNSPEYLGPIVVTENKTVKAIALRQDWSPSGVSSASYTIKCRPPTFSVPAGSYTIGTALTLASPDAGTVLVRYTLDGSTPSATSMAVPAGTTIHLMRNVDVRAVAYKANCLESDPVTATFTVTGDRLDGFVTAGDSDSFAYLNGTLWAWGNNDWGKLGLGNGPPRSLPTPVVWSGVPLAEAAGGSHSLAAVLGGGLQSWGANDRGQLGDPAAGSVRVQPGPAGSFAAGTVLGAAAGQVHSLAVLTDGTVYAWGGGSDGQLGDGSLTYSRYSPAAVTAATGIASVAAASYQSFAVTASGDVLAWGYNNNGQLGNGTTTRATSPVSVVGLSGAVSVAAGYSHTLAVTSSGQAYAWGGNWTGQLGDGTTNQRTTAGIVPGLTGVVAVTAGEASSVALCGDGTVWAWGTGGQGQIGDGTLQMQLRPKRVVGPEKIIAVAAGRYHVLALSQDGVIWAWGWNASGEIGDGTTYWRKSPVAISLPGGSWVVSSPTFNVNPGTYGYELDVRVDTVTPGVTIHYTLDGNDPAATDPTVARGGTVHVSTSATLKARAFLGAETSAVTSASYVLALGYPSITPGGGVITTDQDVTMSAAAGATIRYTTDGTDPSESSSVYSTAIRVSGPLVLEARAFRNGWSPSVTNTATYSAKVASPSFSPSNSAISTPTTVAVTTATPGAEVHYSLDGSEPTLASPLLAGGQVTVGESTTLRARAWRSGWEPSDVAGATFILTRGQTSTPTFTPAAGTYPQPLEVALAADVGATIRYTLDGSDPTWSSPVYMRPLPVAETTTVKARAWVADWTESTVASATYAVDFGQALMPTFSVTAGRYATRRVVTVTCPTPQATVRYTTSGADPTDTDAVIGCGETVTVDRSMILKARAWKEGLTPSAVRQAAYEIDGMVAAGGTHNLALDEEGRVWVWGGNGNGQLGDGSTVSRTAPYRLPTFSASPVVSIAAGKTHSLALTDDGRVWAWGLNNNGQLGDGSTTQRPSPVELPAFSPSVVVALAAGEGHSAALTADGRVWTWGSNPSGQLGDGGGSNRSVPYQLAQFSASPIVAIACGPQDTLALAADGVVWAWGYNMTGALGDGTTTSRNTPVRVSILVRVVRVAAGWQSLAVTSDGGLWAWGDNGSGEVGDGSTVNRSRPVRIAGVEGVVDLAAGYLSSLASVVDPAGGVRLLGWGKNLKGQVGDDSTVDRTRPVLVAGLENPLSIAGGEQHALAVAIDGSVWAWGFNSSGQLGVGTFTDARVPMVVLGLSLVDNSFLTADPDLDSIPTGVELRVGTDPFLRDTNGDGLDDAAALRTGRPPVATDTDGDGLSNAAELAAGTDPLIPDSDGDGVIDGLDPFPLDPTRWSTSPNPSDHTPPTVTLTQPADARLIP